MLLKFPLAPGARKEPALVGFELEANLEMGSSDKALRHIPAVETVLKRPALRAIEGTVGRERLVSATRGVLEDLRQKLRGDPQTAIAVEDVEERIVRRAQASAELSLVPVINATGVILHTNLGRAPLSRAAVERILLTATQYSNLEYDLEQGQRGQRDDHTGRLFAEFLGARSTLVVNNNAAAVFLALNTLAEGAEVIVSRGELIEIGGSFRIPDICAKSGALLREVGTTNRTRLEDYAAAINDRTRLLMRVHPSNFRMVGFTERPALVELVELARQHHLPLLEDLGSGCLLDLGPLGIREEEPVGTSLRAGVSVVTFSGDKLLGGPQAGLLTGEREVLQKIRKNPLFRALRVDKLTIAALQATLALYARGESSAVPALRMIYLSRDELALRAARMAERMAALPGISVEVEDGESVMGGGSTPGQSLPTRLVTLSHGRHGAQALASLLRKNRPPIVARVEEDRVVLDLRTVFEDQEDAMVQAVEAIARAGARSVS